MTSTDFNWPFWVKVRIGLSRRSHHEDIAFHDGDEKFHLSYFIFLPEAKFIV